MIRDRSVQAMVDYLDRDFPLSHNIDLDRWAQTPNAERFAMLSGTERDAIVEQVRLCVQSFEYAARNYFWIVNNQSEDQLFSLWDSQHIVLETMRKLQPRGLATKIFITKARRLGMSVLIENLIAWKAMFFRNTYAIVLSVDEDASADMFGMMQHVYDKMPWWLKPECASREIKGGLVFDRQDERLRAVRPGLNSVVKVQYSTQFSGVGQGRRVSAAHISEISDYQSKRAEEIIEEDLLPAIHETPENFAFIESTAKGTDNYTYHLWRASEKLGERARWFPLFLGWFFETSRVFSIPSEWKPKKQEIAIRERVKNEWVVCGACGHYRAGYSHNEPMAGTTCPLCNAGALKAVVLSDGQLAWHEDRRINAEATSREAVNKFFQEYSTTGEGAFRVSGYSVFDDLCYEKVTGSICTPLTGFIGPDGKFHGYDDETRACFVPGCPDSHYGMSPLDEHFQMWQAPIPGAEYSIGVDVAEGIGADYSVIFVNKIGGMHAPDEQVATWSDNWTDTKKLAFFCNAIGRMYNEGLMCVEANVYQTTADDVLHLYQYPNVYRWRHKEKTENTDAHKWHWWTKAGRKTTLYQNARYWIRTGSWLIRSKTIYSEMTTFVKEGYEEKDASHTKDTHDDQLMAAMVALYCAHELDATDMTSRIPIPKLLDDGSPKNWTMYCDTCGFEWDATDPQEYLRCPHEYEDGTSCSSIRLRGKPKHEQGKPVVDGDALFSAMGHPPPQSVPEPAYDCL